MNKASTGCEVSPARLRRLRYRAWHRGMREMDLLLGPFADAEAGELGESDLLLFETLLDVPDGDLQDWILHGQRAPQDFETPLLQRVRDFHGSGYRP